MWKDSFDKCKVCKDISRLYLISYHMKIDIMIDWVYERDHIVGKVLLMLHLYGKQIKVNTYDYCRCVKYWHDLSNIHILMYVILTLI